MYPISHQPGLRQTWVALTLVAGLSGCASASVATETFVKTGVPVSIVCEPSVEVGDVSAIYASASPSALRWKIEAIDKSENRVPALNLEQAISAAGSKDKLIAALPKLKSNSEILKQLVPGTQEFKETQCNDTERCVAAYVSAPFLPAALVLTPVLLLAGATIDRDRLNQGIFPGHWIDDERLAMKGYAFFPRGNYAAVEYEFWESYDPFDTAKGVRSGTCPWR